MKALYFSTFGGPEVLEYGEGADPRPGPGEALVRTRAIGLNFADVYRRRGNYHLAGSPPYVAGYEAAGVMRRWRVKVRSKSETVLPSPQPACERGPGRGAARRLIPLPDEIGEEVAAAALPQGLTAQYLVRDSHPVQAGESVLVHAAAGGSACYFVQMARRLGARVPL